MTASENNLDIENKRRKRSKWQRKVMARNNGMKA